MLGAFIELNDGWRNVSAQPTFAEDMAMRRAALNPMGLPTSGGGSDGIAMGAGPSEPRTYTVQRGDNPASIGRAFYGDERAGAAILAASGLNASVRGARSLQVGQVLTLPDDLDSQVLRAGGGLISADSSIRIQEAAAQAYALRMSGGPRGGTGVAYGDALRVGDDLALPGGRYGSIQSDQGYLASLSGIASSDLSIGEKLGMTWSTTKYYFRGSEQAQGAAQVVGGGLEVAGAVGLSSTGAGAVLGVPLAFHGGDHIGTGLSRIFREAPQASVTYAAVEGLTGSSQAASFVDQAIPFMAGAAGLAQGANALTAEAFAIQGRQALARDFYTELGWPAKRIESHMRGINFSNEVDIYTLSAGRAVDQWQPSGAAVGNYFSPRGVQPSQLGINPAGRMLETYVPTQSVPVLRSTAAAIVDDWTVLNVPYQTQGGATQYFTGRPDLFVPFKSR